MTEIHIPCPACETRIRFKDGLPDRDAIECPKCGEEVPLRRASRSSRPASRPVLDDSDRRREASSASNRGARYAAAAPRRVHEERKPKESNGSSAGLWFGVIGGSVGLLGLILGVVFFVNSNQEDNSPADKQEVGNDLADKGTSPPLANTNPAQQLVANLLPNAAASKAPGQQVLPLSNGGPPEPTLPPGPDGVIPAPPGVRKVNADSDHLKYGWKANPEFAYRTTIRAEVGDEIQNITGLSKYQVLGHDPALARLAAEGDDEEEEEGLATGTGFVVHPDGYLMTCEHVIDDAAKIEVELGGRTYLARVVEMNSRRDLALIQIAARNLPVLPLADSSRIELAQPVRLVGYPLSDVLGSSVKVTQGSVAGFIERKDGRMIQVDASMNPGNSGGPLVNDRGEAIGVASAGYFGSNIAEVGLAIPTNDVAALMRKNSVAPSSGGAGQTLDGPELAKRVTPSVVYLKVTMGNTPKESLALKHFSSFTTSSQRQDGRPVLGGIPSPKTDSGKLLVDEAGRILHAEGVNQSLPFGLGPLSLLAIEPVSPDGENTWATRRLTTITQVQRQESRYDPFSRFGGGPPSRFGRPRGFPRPPSPFDRGSASETTKTHLAIEVCAYELAESAADLQIIKKTYEFQTIDDVDKPYFRLSGSGSIRFGLTRSLPEHIHYELQLQIRSDDGSISKVPIDVLCDRMTDAELADFNQKTAQTPPRTNPAPLATRSTPKIPKPAENLDEHLATIRDPASNASKKYLAMSALARMEPDEKRRKEVLDVMEPLLKDSNSSVQNTAIKVFGKWGTEDRAGTLIEMAGGLSQTLRWDAMRALGNIGGKKSAEAVAGRLTDATDMVTAANALKEMGNIAEEPVLKLADHPDQQVRYNVYNILGKVGGPKSLAVLKTKAETDPNNFNRAAAGIAQRALEKR